VRLVRVRIDPNERREFALRRCAQIAQAPRAEQLDRPIELDASLGQTGR
jgi:hypothetical protein